MKKIAAFIFTLVLSLAIIAVTAYAEENAITDELDIDMRPVSDSLPDDVKGKLEENNITADSVDEITSITPADVFAYVWDEVKHKASYPVRVFAMMLCVITVNAAVNGFSDCLSNKSLERIYNMVTVLIITSVISEPVSECVALTAETLRSGAEFMICYIPVFSGIAASSGSITSAAAYNTALMLISEAVVWISAEYVMPVLSVCMSLGIIEAINPSFQLTSVTEGISKLVRIALGFVMIIFIGVLSLQSIIGTSADTLGIKAAKYLASNFIPVVGGAVADAYTTIRSSLGILRGGTGFFGIAALFFMTVPVIVEIGIMKLIFDCSDMICSMFGFGNIKIIIKNTSSILAMMLSLMICFTMMLIISTALLMSMGMNMY